MSRILIIEDEVAIADLERDYLELSGFTVEIENTGDVGLARALKEEFDLFILELFKEIWDMESIGDIATVTVHIKKIREKIEFNTAKPQYIETIWGVGYRFQV